MGMEIEKLLLAFFALVLLYWGLKRPADTGGVHGSM